MEEKWLFTLIVISNLVAECICAQKSVMHRCASDPDVATNIIFTLRILINDDPVNSVYAFQASGSVEESADRIASCSNNTGGVTDTTTDPIIIQVTINTTASTHACGSELRTEVKDGVTVTLVDFMFHIYAIGDAFITTDDVTLELTCRSDQLSNDFLTTNLQSNRPKPPVVTLPPQMVAFLEILEAVTKNPMTDTYIGDSVIMSTKFIPSLERGPDNCGTLFYIGFLGNDPARYEDSAADLNIRVVPKYPVRTNVRVKAGTDEEGVLLTSYSGEALIFRFDVDFMGCSDDGNATKEVKGIEIDSYPLEVCVLVFNVEFETEEYYTALPYSVTGTDYVVASMGDAADSSELMIIASEDGTTANLHIPAGAPDITFDETTYSAGETLSVALDKRGTLHLAQTASLSGYRVTSDKPVSLISGNQNFTVNQLPGNHLEEQMPPTSRVGKFYVLAFIRPTTESLDDDWVTEYMLQATVPGTTTVYQYTGTDTNITHTLTYEGTPVVIQITGTTQCEIEADNPILVVLVLTPPAGSQFRGAMVTVPSKFQMAPSYKIQGPDSSKQINFFFIHTGELTISGKDTGITTTIPVQPNVVLGPSGYRTNSDYMMPTDIWTIHSADNISPFMVYVLALLSGGGMSALYLPFNVRYSIFEECVSGGQTGDLYDNDCDLLIDEELINFIDDDSDGLIDEDTQWFIKEFAGAVAMQPVNCKVSGDSSFPNSSITTALTDADGCPVADSAPFSLVSGWAPKTPENGEEIGDFDEMKVLHSGNLTIAMYFGYRHLYFKCDVKLCYSVSDTSCTTEVCQRTGQRRRRQADSDTITNVTATVSVYAFKKTEPEVTNVTTIVEPSLQACLQNSVIQAVSGLLFGLTLLAIVTACCFCFMLKARWKSKKRHSKRRPPSTHSTTWVTDHKKRSRHIHPFYAR